MKTNLEKHPIADLFPMMSPSEFAQLKEDIRVHGQREYIVVWRNQLVDGRNRLKACEELGIEPLISELMDETDPVQYALSLNLHRRHLTPSQLAMIAEKVRGIYEVEAKQAQQKAGGDKKSAKAKSVVENLPQPKNAGEKARDKAAKTVGVSGKSVDMARTVRTKGVPELAKAVESGEVAVSAAAVVAQKPPEVQKQIIERGEVAKAAAEERKAKKAEDATSDQAAVKALKECANPVVVISKMLSTMTQEQVTAVYLHCESLLESK